MRDEFHHDKSRNQTVRLFEDIAKRQSCAPSTWLLSGTPFERGPGDITHWMNALVVETWERDPMLSLALPEKSKEMASRVTSILNKNGKRSGQDDKFLESATSKFGSIMSRLMIRRMTESLWYNQPIVELPPNKHLDVCLSLSAGARTTGARRCSRFVSETVFKLEKQWVQGRRISSPAAAVLAACPPGAPADSVPGFA